MRTLALASLAGLAVASAAMAQAELTALEGTVVRVANDVETPLKVGDKVAVKEEIRTKGDSRAEVALSDGSVVRLGPDSRLRLEDASYDAASRSLSFRARMLGGKLWAEVVKLVQGGTFEVETDNGVAGVRGTQFAVEIAGPMAEAIEVYDGRVAFMPRTALAVVDFSEREAPLLTSPVMGPDEGRMAVARADERKRDTARAESAAPAGPPAGAPVSLARPAPAKAAATDAEPPATPAPEPVLLERGQYLRVERDRMIRMQVAKAENPFSRWVKERQKARPRIHPATPKDRPDRLKDKLHRDRRERRDLRRERLRDRMRLRR